MSPYRRSEISFPSLYQTNLCNSVSSGLAKRMVTLPSAASNCSARDRDISSCDHASRLRMKTSALNIVAKWMTLNGLRQHQ